MISKESIIEGILFYITKPMKPKTLADIVEVSEKEIEGILENLQTNMSERGVSIVRDTKGVMMRTHPDVAPYIEAYEQKEHTQELSKSALETLAIICYKGPITKSEIDYIRGVNSQYTLRGLRIRGLIQKVEDTKKGGQYVPTLEALSFLGVQNQQSLPDYEKINQELAGIEEGVADEGSKD